MKLFNEILEEALKDPEFKETYEKHRAKIRKRLLRTGLRKKIWHYLTRERLIK